MSEVIEVEVPGPVVRAVVTVAQVEHYLERTGWALHEDRGNRRLWKLPAGDGEHHWVDVHLLTRARDWARCMAWEIQCLAAMERRAPHLVLADIAAEVVGAASSIAIDAQSQTR